MPIATPAGDRRTTLEQLRVFLAIVEGDGFSAAGTALGRTQSALTQSLKKLEETVGCRLLDRRQGRVVGLTPAGERLLPQAREILARVDVAVETLRRPALTGRVRIGVPDDVRVADIQAALAGVLAMNADLAVEIRSANSGEIADHYARGALDVALFRRPVGLEIRGPGRIEVLDRMALVWIAAETAQCSSDGPLPLVLYSDGCLYRQAALSLLAAHGRVWRVVYTTNATENLKGAVRAGLGVTVLPSDAVFDGATVLGTRRGFPRLPSVALVLGQRDGDGPHRALAADLATAYRRRRDL